MVVFGTWLLRHGVETITPICQKYPSKRNEDQNFSKIEENFLKAINREKDADRIMLKKKCTSSAFLKSVWKLALYQLLKSPLAIKWLHWSHLTSFFTSNPFWFQNKSQKVDADKKDIKSIRTLKKYYFFNNILL